jgi:hypothetical protein
MRQLLAPLLLLCSTGASFDAMAQMHKCVDEGGKITFSDRPCATPTSSAQALSAPAPMKSKDGQLSEAAVIAMVQRMVSLATQMDHSAQCAVLAPDFAKSFGRSIEGFRVGASFQRLQSDRQQRRD